MSEIDPQLSSREFAREIADEACLAVAGFESDESAPAQRKAVEFMIQVAVAMQERATILNQEQLDGAKFDKFNGDTEHWARHAIFPAGIRGGEIRGSKLADIDHLTGIQNRRGWFKALESATNGQVINDKRKAQLQQAVFIIDLDEFKTVNDINGHVAGDTVLRRVGEILETHTRDDDLVARIGGDEFAVLAKTYDETDSHWQEKKRVSIQEALNDSVTLENGSSVEFSGSVGVAALKPADTPSSVMERADVHQYEVKREREKLIAS